MIIIIFFKYDYFLFIYMILNMMINLRFRPEDISIIMVISIAYIQLCGIFLLALTQRQITQNILYWEHFNSF